MKGTISNWRRKPNRKWNAIRNFLKNLDRQELRALHWDPRYSLHQGGEACIRPIYCGQQIAESVLTGENVEGLTLEATEILKECRRKVDEGEDQISTKKMRTGFKRCNERTSISFLRLHLGMYKNLTKLNEQREEKEYLLKVIMGIVNTAMNMGISLSRWCLVHNILLEKDPNNPTLHSLRIIHIIEANYNLLLGQDTYENVEERKTSDRLKLGMKESTAQDAGAKELHYDLAHLSLKEYATTEKDAKPCYNHMVSSLIMLIGRSFGLKKCLKGSRKTL